MLYIFLNKLFKRVWNYCLFLALSDGTEGLTCLGISVLSGTLLQEVGCSLGFLGFRSSVFYALRVVYVIGAFLHIVPGFLLKVGVIQFACYIQT